MKQAPLIFLCVLAAFACHAQPDKYHVSELGVWDIHNGRRISYVENGLYLIAGSGKRIPNRWHPFFLETDGNEVFQLFTDSVEPYGGTVLDMTHSDKGYLAAGHASLTVGGSGISYYLALSDSGGFQYSMIGSVDMSNNMTSCVLAQDGGHLLGGAYIPYTSAPYWQELYLIKLDSLYNQVWDTVYYGLPYGNNSYIKDMLANPDGSFHLLATVEDFYGDPSGRVLLMHIDPAGNILNQTTYDLGDDEETFHLLRTGDGGLMLSMVSNLETPADRTAHIYKLDELGDTQWTRTCLPTGVVRKAVQLNNGSYTLCGYYTPPEKIRLDVAILKLDTAGNLLWQRSYGGPYHDYAYDMIFEADDSTGKSGYVICGRKDLGAGGHANVYFLKLNCMGLLEEPYAEFAAGVAPPGNDPLLVQFQNISKYVYPDSIDGGFYLWDFGDGTPPLAQHSDTVAVPLHQYPEAGVYRPTLTGIVCNDTATHTQTLCVGEATPEFLYAPTPGVGHGVSFTNHSHLGADPYTVMEGVYLWDFGDGNQSAEMHPAHVYHAPGTYVVTLTAVFCTDTVAATQTVVVEAVGINSPDRGCGICVLPPSPNPAAAGSPVRIGIEFPHFIPNKTATLRLYDPNGRLLHEGRQTGSGHYALSTSGLPAGLYLYGVEWEGNVLARGKVAVF